MRTITLLCSALAASAAVFAATAVPAQEVGSSQWQERCGNNRAQIVELDRTKSQLEESNASYRLDEATSQGVQTARRNFVHYDRLVNNATSRNTDTHERNVAQRDYWALTVDSLERKRRWIAENEARLQQIDEQLRFHRNRMAELRCDLSAPSADPAAVALAGNWNGADWRDVVITGGPDSFAGTYTGVYDPQRGAGTFNFSRLPDGSFEGRWFDSDGKHNGKFTLIPSGNGLIVKWESLDGEPRSGTSDWSRN